MGNTKFSSLTAQNISIKIKIKYKSFMKLIIIRHGQTEENLNAIVAGQTHGTLTQLGVEQAKKLAERLQNHQINSAYSSDLKRTFNTATEILKYHPHIQLITDIDLRERSTGIFDGGLGKEYGKFLDTHNDTVGDVRPPKGESLQDLQKRTRNFLEKIIQKHEPDETVLICTHGGWIRAIIADLLQANIRDTFRTLGLNNTSVTVIEIGEDNKKKLRLINCTKHLED